MPSVEITEKTYLKRINTLNQSCAIPLRQFSKSSSTRIIDKHEATSMFGKIEYIAKANQSLLPVLETCLKSLIKGQTDWSDQLCEQLEKIQKPYCDYLAGYDSIKDTEQRLLKKSKGFRQFCERTKKSMYNDRMGRVGLRELQMEPFQRVTCYILIFKQILKKMPSDNPARANLLSCISTCNWIAFCELDSHLIKAETICVSFQR
ncbi:Dbl homology domain-containing protein [Phakopsora pachyrhizi]|uniref:Dbl homology domain-containing protein n=1 Tax=Phakopsora pachyrhizi TaxID=170000 RepID=A0AAV0B7J4_PHAPC|nr:Dbl homology domain-containing protein [Phakopsora pachyrhizi]CAH7683017.1 Dbl homology domain-containing protein [Phakopsora pachyrhizi]